MRVSRQLFATIVLGGFAAVAGPVTLAQNSEQQVSAGQQPGAPQPILEEVIVRGQRMSEIEFDIDIYIQDFLAEVVALPPGGGYARWHQKVCVGVHNLEARATAYLQERITRLANEVGLETGEPDCAPDVIIIFTVNADEVATTLVEEQPFLFRPGGPTCCMQLGLEALDDFKVSDDPVRWWHVSMPVDAQLGQRAIKLPQDGPGSYPIISVAGPSRIHSGVVDKLWHVIVVVDATRLTGTTWQEIGDYLAVISLAQIDPKTAPDEYDSILNLFSNPAAYTGLTDWDRSYVRALYAVNMERLRGLQQNEIVDHMAKQERALSE